MTRQKIYMRTSISDKENNLDFTLITFWVSLYEWWKQKRKFESMPRPSYCSLYTAFYYLLYGPFLRKSWYTTNTWSGIVQPAWYTVQSFHFLLKETLHYFMTYLLIGLQDCWCCFCQFIFHVYVLDDQIMHKLTRIRGALSFCNHI